MKNVSEKRNNRIKLVALAVFAFIFFVFPTSVSSHHYYYNSGDLYYGISAAGGFNGFYGIYGGSYYGSIGFGGNLGYGNDIDYGDEIGFNNSISYEESSINYGNDLGYDGDLNYGGDLNYSSGDLEYNGNINYSSGNLGQNSGVLGYGSGDLGYNGDISYGSGDLDYDGDLEYRSGDFDYEPLDFFRDLLDYDGNLSFGDRISNAFAGNLASADAVFLNQIPHTGANGIITSVIFIVVLLIISTAISLIYIRKYKKKSQSLKISDFKSENKKLRG